MSLPSFLEPLPSKGSVLGYFNAIFHHKHLSAFAHSLWWPSKKGTPDTIILFIPGNPGLLDFYIPFLSAIYDKDTTSRLAIFGHAHIGHTPAIEHMHKDISGGCGSHYGLNTQMEGVVEAFDAVQHTYGSEAEVAIIGHSVGAWLSLQPTLVSAAFLLFPTISYIGNTPNGKRYSWAFSPYLRPMISSFSYLAMLIPTSFFSRLYRDWPLTQITTLLKFLRSSSSIRASLCMAHDEMKVIRGLDSSLLSKHQHKLRFYFAEQDDWVGDEKARLLRSLEPPHGALRVAHGQRDIPHAFCITHGEHVAEQCYHWLTELSLNLTRL